MTSNQPSDMLTSIVETSRRLWHWLTHQTPQPTDRIAYMVGWETAKEFAEDKPNPYPEGTEQHHSWYWGFQDARSDFRDTW